MKKLIGIVTTGLLAVGLGAGITACSDSPATIQAKYKCTKTVDHKQKTAWCVTDSNGYAYYIPRLLWMQTRLGQDETKGRLGSYTQGDSTVPSDNLPPAQRENIANNDGGGDYNVNDSGYIAPVHEAPVEAPVEVHPVVVDR